MAENIFDDAMLKSRGLPVEKGGFRLGDCIIKRKLGAGGMGAVYEGVHTRLDCPVAVKIMHPNIASANTESVQRFIREAKLAAKLNMPGMIRVFDVNNLDDMYYIVMEFVEGDSLQDIVKRDGPTPEVNALRYIGEACKAMGMAHEKGVIHRDIKPDNIMVDKSGRIMIADLGLAKSLLASSGEQLSMDGSTMGTPSYMSPEQAMDSTKADYRSDIYSMGATLWAMLAAEAPFQAQTALHILQKVLSEELEDIRTKRPDVSEKTAQFIKEMTAKEPHMRPASIGDIGEEMLKHATILESQGQGMVVGGNSGATGGMQSPSSLNYEKTLVQSETGGMGTSIKTDPTLRMAGAAGTIQAPTAPMQPEGKSLKPLVAAVLFIVLVAGIALIVALTRKKPNTGGTEISGVTGNVAVTEPGSTKNTEQNTGQNTVGGKDVDITATTSPVAVDYAALPDEYKISLADSVTLPFRKVSPGAFIMGDDSMGIEFEMPVHEVEFTKYFYLCETEVTWRQFIEYLNSDARTARMLRKKWNKSEDSRPASATPAKDGKFSITDNDLDKPVGGITQTQASEYAFWLNKAYAGKQSPVLGWRVRLPSEEEWEYAARGPLRKTPDGSTSSRYPWGDEDVASIPATGADYPFEEEGQSFGGPVSVNDERFTDDVSWCGIKGMAGNVQEWTASFIYPYSKKKVIDPQPYTGGSIWSPSNPLAVIKGSSFHGNMGLPRCRGAFRDAKDPKVITRPYIGFRLYLGPIK